MLQTRPTSRNPSRAPGGLARCAAATFAFALALAAGSASGGNLGFEAAPDADSAGIAGWTLRVRGARVTSETRVVAEGTRSLRLDLDGAGANVRLTQRVPTAGLTGNRVRIEAAVKAADAARAAASLEVRVDGADALLYVDRAAPRPLAGGGAPWSRLVLEAPLAAGAETLRFGASVRGRGHVWLDDFVVESYDTARLPPPSPAAQRYLERALSIMRRHALRRDSVDWDALAEAALAQARGAETPAEAYLAVQFALTSLGDRHSYFMPPARMRALEREPVSNARTGRPAVAAMSEPLGERIGYLRVPGYAGGSQADQARYADDLQERIESLDMPPRCGWVVDLRGNSGGNLWPMLAGLGPLVGEGEVGAALHPGGSREPIAYRDGKVSLAGHVQLRVRRGPYRIARPAAPVAVLVDGRTASSAEILALLLGARDEVRSFGTPTRGVPTATRTFPLQDGAALILTVAATSDRDGHVAEGSLEPDVRVDAADPGSPAAAQAPLLAAIDWLTNRYGCW